MKPREICGYTIDRRIGEGSFGTVIKVNDSNQNDIAFKVIKADSKSDIGIPSLLEIDIMTRLSHPYLMHALEIYTPLTCLDLIGSTVGISMPLARTDLGIVFHPELISDKLVNPNFDLNPEDLIFSFQMKIRLIWQILQGVLFLHQMNIYHLDLKPWNILLFGSINDPQDPLIAKISDFGLAYYCPFPIKGCPDITRRGTRTYQAPELYEPIHYCYPLYREFILRNRYLYNEKSDLWSIGMIIGEIISEKRMIQVSSTKGLDRFIHVIFSPDNIDNFLDNYLSDNSSKFDPSMDQIKSIIKKSLSFNPTDRPSISKILNSPIFNPFETKNRKESGIIYSPIIGSQKEINYRGYQNGVFVIEEFFRSYFYLDDVGTFFLAVDIYYRALSFYKNISSDIIKIKTLQNIQILQDNFLLIAGASTLLARGFYNIQTDLLDILHFADLSLKYNPNNLYEMEQHILNLFGNIIYRPYIYEKSPNIEALLSSYSLLVNPNYLRLDLDDFYYNQSNYQLDHGSKQKSVREYFSLI